MLLIVVCWFVKYAMNKALQGAMSASNAIMMEQTLRFLKPTIWVTAIPRIFYILRSDIASAPLRQDAEGVVSGATLARSDVLHFLHHSADSGAMRNKEI